MLINILISLSLAALIEFGLRYAVGWSLPGVLFVGLYLILFYIVEYVRAQWSAHPEREQWLATWGEYPLEDLSQIRASGPVRHAGRRALMLTFFSSQLLMLLNPWQLVEVIKQLVGNASLAWRERQTRDNKQHYETKLDYRLPVKGEWLVLNGGMTPATSHSWGIMGQRYALDLVIADESLTRHANDGTRLEDYLCYDQPIVAAQAGVVVAREDRVKDSPLVGWGLCDITAKSFMGNYLVIRHAENEYALYAHLKPGSIRVSLGDQVAMGQTIASCGHSGHSTEPHLHFHLQDSPDPYHGMGLPIAFSQLEIGGQPAWRARLRSGHRVRRVTVKSSLGEG